MMGWGRKEIGEGNYNKTYKSDDGAWILKVQKARTLLYDTDAPERSVRLWNSINAHIHPPAALVTTSPHGSGWRCPFIEGRQSSDAEMSHALIDIFNRTGRIVVDATAPGNFRTTATGQVVCVDIGMALQMERRENDLLTPIPMERQRSHTSLHAWRGLHHEYNKFFRDSVAAGNPHTVETIKALLFIKANRPNIIDASFLRHHPTILSRMARAYDAEDRTLLTDLERIQPSPGVPRPLAPPTVPVGTGLPSIEPAVVPLISDTVDPESTLAAARAMTRRELGDDSRALHMMLTKGAPRSDEVTIAEGKKALAKERSPSLENLKESCIKELERYINSRGSINSEGEFVASNRTKLFRNAALTGQKVAIIQDLIKDIKSSSDFTELRGCFSLLKTLDEDQKTLKKGWYSSDVNTSLERCQLMIDNAAEMRTEYRHESRARLDLAS